KKRRKTRFTHTCSVVFSKRMNRICFVLRIFLSILQKFIPLFGQIENEPIVFIAFSLESLK
ncbi:MAG: hypothetical protein AAF600_10625, partial [Bacteroidota bacterium]